MIQDHVRMKVLKCVNIPTTERNKFTLEIGKKYHCKELDNHSDYYQNDLVKENKDFFYAVYKNEIFIGFYGKVLFESISKKRNRILDNILDI